MNWITWTTRVVRWLYAAFYAFVGVQALLALAGLIPRPDFGMSERNAAFQAALEASGFFVPVMAVVFVVAGVLMLFDRTTPLGIVLLAPLVLGIFFIHLMLDGNVVWGTAHAGPLALFAWQFRSAFRPLWNHSRLGQEQQAAVPAATGEVLR